MGRQFKPDQKLLEINDTSLKAVQTFPPKYPRGILVKARMDTPKYGETPRDT